MRRAPGLLEVQQADGPDTARCAGTGIRGRNHREAEHGIVRKDYAERIRPQSEKVPRITDDMTDALRASLERLKVMDRTLQEAAERSAGAISQLARRSTGRAMQGFGQTDEELRGLIAETSENLRTVAETNTALAHSFEHMSREWFRLSQRRLQQNLDGFSALARCRSTTEFIEVQRSLALAYLEQSVEASRRLAEIAVRMADEATRTISVQTESPPGQAERAVKVEKTVRRVGRAA